MTVAPASSRSDCTDFTSASDCCIDTINTRRPASLPGSTSGAICGGELLLLVHLGLQAVHLRPVLLILRRQLRHLMLQLIGERPVQRGRADDQADGEREEHRRQGDDVIPEVDHYNSPRTEKIKWSHHSASRLTYARPTVETATAAAIAAIAVSTSSSSAGPEMRLPVEAAHTLGVDQLTADLEPGQERRRHAAAALVQELDEVVVRADRDDHRRALLVGQQHRDVLAGRRGREGRVADTPSCCTRASPGARPSG